MKQNRLLLSVIMFLLITSLVMATESALELIPQYAVKATPVSFQNGSQMIKGILTVPDKENTAWPIVVLFHGFTADKNGIPIKGTQETMFGMAARLLAEQGFASLRIDFRGSGESEGKWEDTTYSGQISDGLAAINYVCTLQNIDKTKIAVAGHSQGGLVAACVAKRDPRIKSAILLAPVATPSWTGFNVLGMEAVQKGLKDKDALISVTLPWGTTQLKGAYFQELFCINPVAEIAQFHGALLVVVGAKDYVVWPQPQEGNLYLLYHPGEESLVLLDTDHIFSVLEGPEYMDKAIYWMLDWVKNSLK